MAGAQNTARTPPPPANTAATLRKREHEIRNKLFALTIRTDLTSEHVARQREELSRQLARARALLNRSQALVKRARERHRATFTAARTTATSCPGS